MRAGMLWRIGAGHRNLEDVVKDAMQDYQSKYRVRPTLCYIHPSIVPDPPISIEGLEIQMTTVTAPNTLWLGILGDQERQEYSP